MRTVFLAFSRFTMRQSIAIWLFVFLTSSAIAQSAGDYRTTSPGNWDSNVIWERFNGTLWVPATSSPTYTDNGISILHTVTIPAGVTVSADQIRIEGALTVAANGRLNLLNGSGIDLTIGSSLAALNINGLIDRRDLSTIANAFSAANIMIGAGGAFYHNYRTSVGDLPSATWNAASTLFITGFANTTPITANTTWDQTFGNVVYSSAAQRAIVDFDGNLRIIKGNLTVASTGRGVFRLNGAKSLQIDIGAANSAVGGDLIISGSSRVDFSTTGSPTVNVYGDFTFTAPSAGGTYLTYQGQAIMNLFGDFNMNATSTGRFRLGGAGNTGRSTINFLGNFTLASGRIDELGSDPTSATLRFIRNGTQTFVNSAGLTTGGIFGEMNYYISPTTTLNVSIYPLTGKGSFVLDGSLVVGSLEPTGAITSTITLGNIRTTVAKRRFNVGSTIRYAGTSPMFIGAGHPAAVNTVINNPSGVRLVSNVTSAANFRLESGTLDLNVYRFTSFGTLQSVNGDFAGSDLASIVIQGNGDGNWGTLDFLPTADTLGLLYISRSGVNAHATIGNSITIKSNLTLVNGTIVNNGILDMADNATVTRYPLGALGGTALSISEGSYNVTYSTLAVAGSPLATITTGLELPDDQTSLKNITIACSANGDQILLNKHIWVNGALNLSAGSFSQGGFNITMLGRNWNDDAGTLVPGAGTVIFNGDSTRVYGTLNPLFGNIAIMSGKKAQFDRSFSVQGNLYFEPAAEFAMGGNTMILSGANPQTLSPNGAVFSNITVTKANQTIALASKTSLTGILQFGASSNVNFASNGHLNLLSLSDSGGAGTAGSIYILSRGNVVSGNVLVERYTSAEGRIYRYLSSPVSNATVAQLKDDFLVQGNFADPSPTQTVCGLRASAGTSTLFYYDETVAGGRNAGYVAYPAPGFTSDASPLAAGRGYAAFIRQCTVATVIDYTGPINQGVVRLPVTYTVSDPAGDGWNLVGNPYPSTIDWDITGWTRTRISSIIAITDNAVGMIRYYDAGVTDEIPNGQIASGQGFWVLANGPAPFLAMRESVKVNTVASYYRERGTSIPSFSIALSDEENVDKAYIKILPTASSSFDTLDAPKIANPNFSLSTLSSDNHPMAINAIDELSCGDILLKMEGLEPGTYSIALNLRDNFQGYHFTLVDKFNGRQVDLGSSYSFEVTDNPETASEDRFKITVASDLMIAEVQVLSPKGACSDMNEIRIASSDSKVKYAIADQTGRFLTQPIQGNGKDLSIMIASDSLADGINQLKVHAALGCASGFVKGDFSIIKSNTPAITLSSQFDCDARTSLLKAEGNADMSFQWYDRPEGEDVIFEGAELTTPVLEKDKTYYVTGVNRVSGCLTARSPIKTDISIFERDPEITVDGTVLLSNFEDGNQWYFDGEPIPGASKKELPLKENGLYELTVNVKGCTKSTAFEYGETTIPGISVYPNPTAEFLTIDGVDEDIDAIGLSGVTGQLFKSVYKKGQKFEGKIDLTSMPDGLYLLTIEKANRKYPYRILKRAK